MKLNLFLTFGMAIALFFTASAQDQPTNVPKVSKAVYFDKTPPLRDMKIILPGERHRTWKDNEIENKSVEDKYQHRHANIPKDFKDPVLQKNYNSGRSIMGPVTNHDGVGNRNGVYPPDTEGDVGPNHYFQMINLSFAIWDKEGNLLYGPVDNSTLWSGFIGPWTGTNDGDPVVVYDELADRWMATQFAINTSNGTYWELVAISQTPDPLGSYYRYAFQFPAFNDYPKLSVWPDGYYASFNMFGSYTRVGVAAFQRDSMLVGSPNAEMVYFDQSGNTFSMLPSDFDGTPPPEGSPCYFGHLRTFGDQNFEIYEFHVDWDTPANSTFNLAASLQPASFNPNVNDVPQPGTSQHLDPLNAMLMYRLQYRNFGSYETMVTNHTVNVSGHAAVRWYEFRKESGSDWSIYQQGTYSPDNENRWMGSIAMNGNGDIALGFSKSSSSTYPSIYYTGRRSDDTLGEMSLDEVQIIGGTSSQSGISRWGDYSCMSVDPVDDSTFWFTTEYMGGPWKTRIASFNFGPILPPMVNAGDDTLICSADPFSTNATAQYQQTVLWETDGDGFFVDPSILNAIYLRGSGDVDSGHVQLKINAYGYNAGEMAQDSMILSFTNMATAYAGPDTTVCINESVLLNGTATNYDSLRWTTDGDGTFDNDTILHPYYTPGADDNAAGHVYLQLTAYDVSPCSQYDNDKMKLTIDECTGISENAQGKPRLKVIPNPATSQVQLDLTGFAPEDKVVLTMANAEGQVVFTMRLDTGKGNYSNKMDFSYFPRGIYYMKASNGTFSVNTKLILQ